MIYLILLYFILVGYRTVAIEQIFDHRKLQKIPDPENINDLTTEWKGKLQILQRLTIIYENPNIVHLMVMVPFFCGKIINAFLLNKILE